MGVPLGRPFASVRIHCPDGLCPGGDPSQTRGLHLIACISSTLGLGCGILAPHRTKHPCCGGSGCSVGVESSRLSARVILPNLSALGLVAHVLAVRGCEFSIPDSRKIPPSCEPLRLSGRG